MIRTVPFCEATYLARCQQAELADARYVADLYSSVVIDLVHPGNLGPLPPSRSTLMHKAEQLGLLESQHRWALGSCN